MARFVCAFFLSVVSTASLGATTIDLGPSDYKNFGPNGAHTGAGIRSSFGQTVRMPPSGANLGVTRNPVIPYGSVGTALKNISRATPGAIAASAGMAALFAAMDWVFEQGQWKKEDLEQLDDLYGYYWTAPGVGSSHPSALDACTAGAYFPAYGLADFVSLSIASNGNAICTYNKVKGGLTNFTAYRGGGGCPEGYTYSVVDNNAACFRTALVPLTDGDYSELTAKLPTLPAGDVSGAAGDASRHQGAPLSGYSDTNMTGPASTSGPSSTSTTSDSSGTHTSTTSVTHNHSYGPTTITTTTTTTTNNYSNGEHTGTETITETPSPDPIPDTGGGGSIDLDIPTDCEFMPTICAFIDWFKEPVPMPEPDLPVVVDHDFEREYEMNLTGECPPPYTVETQLFGTLSISWQPFCDLASLIKPLVVGSAFLLSAFITLGIGRGKS